MEVARGYFGQYSTDVYTNKSVDIIRGPWVKMKNGSWGGGMGMVTDKKIDVLSNGIAVNLQRSSAIDYTFPTSRSANTFRGASRPLKSNMSI